MKGCLVAVGCNNGNTALLELSDSLSVRIFQHRHYHRCHHHHPDHHRRHHHHDHHHPDHHYCHIFNIIINMVITIIMIMIMMTIIRTVNSISLIVAGCVQGVPKKSWFQN